MTIEEITEYIVKKATDVDPVGGVLKVIIDGGIVHIDGTGETNIISNEDKEAECTITTSFDTLKQLREGNLNPMMAMMKGQLKVKGNMMLAAKLEKLL